MLAKVYSCAVIGLDGAIVEVEVDTANGLPTFVVVGLPDAAVQESRERVQAAIRNAGFYFPQKRLTVNLAPASIRKEGPAYDLPIALGVLAAAGQIMPEAFEGALVMGELSLDGERAPRARGAAYDGPGAGRGLSPRLCPGGRCRRGRPGPRHCHSGLEWCEHLCADRLPRSQGPGARQARAGGGGRGRAQRHHDRAAWRRENTASPRTPSILPGMTIDEALDVTRVYSVADQLPPGTPLIQQRPFRAPHHTISHVDLV